MNSRFTDLLQNKGLQSPQKALVYTIQRGDTLSQIIHRHYKATPNTLDYRVAEAAILEYNHHINHPDRIFEGDIVRLMPLPDIHSAGSCLAPDSYRNPDLRSPTRQRFEPLHSHPSARIRDAMPQQEDEQVAFSLLSELEEHHGIISTSIGGGVNAFGNLVGQGNSELIREITELHEDFHADKMTRNQYNYRRQNVVKKIAGRMGPVFERNQLRIDQRKGVIPTHRIEAHADHIARLSRYANSGGLILAGVGAALSCRDIGNTDDRQEKNEIFVETAFSTIVGLGTGAIMSVLLISNPVGWGVAIVLGVGSAALAFGSGKYAKYVYGSNFQEYDLVNMTKLDQLCK